MDQRNWNEQQLPKYQEDVQMFRKCDSQVNEVILDVGIFSILC